MRKRFFLKNILRLRLLLFLNIVIFCFLSFSFVKEYVRQYSIQQEIKELQEQAESLKTQNMELTQWQRLFQTEVFLEKEARLKLGLQKPGEQTVIIQRPQTQEDTLAQQTEQEAQEKKSSLWENPKKWWNYFFAVKPEI